MDNVTFGRMDDEEEQAFKDVILRANRQEDSDGTTFPDHHASVHRQIEDKLSVAHTFEYAPLLRAFEDNGRLKHEMALEAGLIAQLSDDVALTTSVFESWDFVTHQVLASPFKPLKWADRMDVFGYRFIAGFRPTIGRYLVVEAKKDRAESDDVDQLMKYVDWLRDEYAGGDYSLVRAYLVAADFSPAARDRSTSEASQRIFTIGLKPAKVDTWNRVRLVKYEFDSPSGKLLFTELSPN